MGGCQAHKGTINGCVNIYYVDTMKEKKLRKNFFFFLLEHVLAILEFFTLRNGAQCNVVCPQLSDTNGYLYIFKEDK